jgi:hypothetical protein
MAPLDYSRFDKLSDDDTDETDGAIDKHTESMSALRRLLHRVDPHVRARCGAESSP